MRHLGGSRQEGRLLQTATERENGLQAGCGAYRLGFTYQSR